MSVKDKLIKDIYECAIDLNLWKSKDNMKSMDEILVALQIIEDNEQYTLFQELEGKDFFVYFEDYEYVKEIRIDLQDGSKESYHIKFSYDYKAGEYCNCDVRLVDFNKEFNCCGKHCEWEAPLISIKKTVSLGQIVWRKTQHEYWKYKKDLLNKYSHIYDMCDQKLLDLKHARLISKLKTLKDTFQQIEKEEKELKNKIEEVETKLKNSPKTF